MITFRLELTLEAKPNLFWPVLFPYYTDTRVLDKKAIPSDKILQTKFVPITNSLVNNFF